MDSVYYQLVFGDEPESLYFAYLSLGEAEQKVELHRQHGDSPRIVIRTGRLVRGGYGKRSRVVVEGDPPCEPDATGGLPGPGW